jgi:outer membrane receptor protein involved in Fe transport
MTIRAVAVVAAVRSAAVIALVTLWLPAGARAQATGTVTGRVTRRDGGAPLAGVSVSIQGTGIAAATGPDGTYQLQRVPAGQQTVSFRWLGYEPQQAPVTVTPGGSATVNVALRAQPVALQEVVVTASRAPERVVEAPAAVAIADLPEIRAAAATGQLPRAIENLPGVDLVQSGMSDFNLNTRGFNSSLNRRVLVLQDGRDLSVAFLGAQEWSANAPLEDGARVELVRGPGSALYGANAFSGVLSITTPTARDAVGTRVMFTGGQLNSFNANFRQAGVFAQGRFGYKVEGGYSTSDTWSRSRTRTDASDFFAEYRAVTGTNPNPPTFTYEHRPLNGQVLLDSTTGTITGTRDPIVNMFGTGRLDYYAANGAVGTVEGGAADVQNTVIVTGIGRVQVTNALRPWARATWAAKRYNLEAWYSGRNSIDPQYALASALPLEEHSSIFHVEGQVNQAFLQDRMHVVAGASFRTTHVNTDTTLMMDPDDNRTDNYYSAYGQVEYAPVPQLRLVGAARWDKGDLFAAQVSPKGAIVFSPNENHSFRLTFNQAFQTPNYSEFFLRVPVAAPSPQPAALEQGIETLFRMVNDSLGTAVTDLKLPNDLPWNFGPLTQALALGNRNLKVEQVTGWELGYKGEISHKGYVTIDGYINDLKNFVTDLLPGVNPEYPSFSLTDSVNVPNKLSALDTRVLQLRAGGFITAADSARLRGAIAQLQAGYGQLAPEASLLATIGGNQRALVVSYTNAGHVTERGIEIGAGYYVTNELKLEASYTFFAFTVDSTQTAAGDMLLPNTPKHKGTFTASYAGAQGIDAAVTVRATDAYDWAAGVYAGPIPSSQMVDVNLGYRVNTYVRLFAVGTDVFDQQRFMLYGGSVNGRRVVGGVTATF